MKKLFHFPRKRFGQHFLVDLQIIDHIVTAISASTQDALLEIGPGQGALTQALLPNVDQLTVIELDRDLIPYLHALSSPQHQIKVIAQDALKVNLCEIQNNQKPWRVIGNLPYNISTPLLFHLLNFHDIIQDMTFMLQKEVVDRLTAEPGCADYGRLSIMVQYLCHCEFLFDVPPESFNPPPKVNSAMVRITPLPQPLVKAEDETLFADIVRTAFSARRKTIRNALKNIIPLQYFEDLNINSEQRPENLTVQNYVALANKMFAKGDEEEHIMKFRS